MPVHLIFKYLKIFIDVLIVKIKIIVTSFDGRLWIDIFDFCQRFWCCLLSCCGVVLLRCCGVVLLRCCGVGI